MKKIVDGMLMDLTSEDLAQREIDIAARPSELNMALLSLRSKRNNLLAKTDWTANSDVTMSDAWKKYRQDLRDLPASATPSLDEHGNLTNVTWPTKPS